MKKGLILGFLTLILLFPTRGRAAETRLLTEADGIRLGYDQGFLLNVNDKFEMKFGAFLQFQYAHLDKDAPAQPSVSTFKIAKGRLRWTGFMYNPKIGYVIQLEVANGTTNKNVALKDFKIDLKHYPNAKFRIGQFKIPFNRQQLTFFAELQLVDASIASKEFNANQVNARDIGVQVSGAYYDHKLEYFAGIFNGNGINSNNDTTKFLTMGRLVYNPFGKMSLAESDMAQSKEPLLSVGIGLARDAGKTDGGFPNASATTLGLEAAYKFSGLSVLGEYYHRDDNKNPDADGFYIQAGVFAVPSFIEFAGRVSVVNPDGANNDKSEVTVGLNLFFNGHRHKLQIDVSALEEEVPAGGGNPAQEFDDEQVRVQYQVSF
ncbi:MAG: porin [Nitrospiria bacterium]